MEPGQTEIIVKAIIIIVVLVVVYAMAAAGKVNGRNG